MQAEFKLLGISSILPRMRERIYSEVTYLDGTSVFVPLKPLTVVERIAGYNLVDFNRVKALSQKLNFRRKGVPIPSGLVDAFLPFHLVEELEQGYACYGFCNVANQRVDVLAVPGKSRYSFLRLENGRKLLVNMSPDVMSKYLAGAVSTHRRFIQEFTETLEPCALKTLITMMVIGFPMI